jgi:hypothetical protein
VQSGASRPRKMPREPQRRQGRSLRWGMLPPSQRTVRDPWKNLASSLSGLYEHFAMLLGRIIRGGRRHR